MRIQSFLFILLMLGLGFSADAQREETVLGSRGLGWSGAWGGGHNMLTPMGETNAFLSGGFGGLEFGKTLFVGWGGYVLANDVEWDNVGDTGFDLEYSGLMLGYGHKNYKPIHPTVKLLVGRGNVSGFNNSPKDRIFVLQPSAGVEINIFRWMHLNLDAGYRFVSDVTTEGLSDTDLSGGFGQVGLKFGFSWGKKTGWGKSKKSKVRIDVD